MGVYKIKNKNGKGTNFTRNVVFAGSAHIECLVEMTKFRRYVKWIKVRIEESQKWSIYLSKLVRIGKRAFDKAITLILHLLICVIIIINYHTQHSFILFYSINMLLTVTDYELEYSFAWPNFTNYQIFNFFYTNRSSAFLSYIPRLIIVCSTSY